MRTKRPTARLSNFHTLGQTKHRLTAEHWPGIATTTRWVSYRIQRILQNDDQCFSLIMMMTIGKFTFWKLRCEALIGKLYSCGLHVSTTSFASGLLGTLGKGKLITLKAPESSPLSFCGFYCFLELGTPSGWGKLGSWPNVFP